MCTLGMLRISVLLTWGIRLCLLRRFKLRLILEGLQSAGSSATGVLEGYALLSSLHKGIYGHYHGHG